MAFEPTHLKLWNDPRYYVGQTWEGYYVALSQTRDSGTLERSNYRVMLARLREVAAGHETPEAEPTVGDTREGHWACGWVEWIHVWSGDEEAVRAADEMLARLEDYGVLSEDDWARLEMEEADSCWESMSLADRVVACRRFDVSVFAARRAEVPSDPRGELVSWLADSC